MPRMDPLDPERRKFLLSTGAVTGGIAASSCLKAAPAIEANTSQPALVSRVSFTVNGTVRELEVDPRVTLLDLLREHLHLTGTKKGCDRGQCGACTVLLNGRRTNACLVLAAAQDGSAVATIEGLAECGQLHPVQQSFIDHDGFQCG